MSHRQFALALLGTALAACEAEPRPEEPDSPRVVEDPATSSTTKNGRPELYGEPLSRGVELVELDDLIANPGGYAGITMQTEGIVRANCQKRGCWMEVRSMNDAASPGVTVRFLNYGFFIPLDSRGTIVRVEGSIEIDELTEEEVDDLIGEGHDPGIVQPDGTARVVTFTASGVEMWNRDK